MDNNPVLTILTNNLSIKIITIEITKYKKYPNTAILSPPGLGK